MVPTPDPYAPHIISTGDAFEPRANGCVGVLAPPRPPAAPSAAAAAAGATTPLTAAALSHLEEAASDSSSSSSLGGAHTLRPRSRAPAATTASAATMVTMAPAGVMSGLAWSRDGGAIAASRTDGAVWLFDVASGVCERAWRDDAAAAAAATAAEAGLMDGGGGGGVAFAGASVCLPVAARRPRRAARRLRGRAFRKQEPMSPRQKNLDRV